MANEFPFQIRIKGIDDITGPLKKVRDQIKNVSSSLTNLGNRLTLTTTLPLIGAATLAVHDYIESLDAIKQVANSFKNSGAKVGLTLADIKKAAVDLQSVSLFDDDKILRDVSNSLLKFSNVTGTRFLKAQEAIVNIAASQNKDLASVTKAVGRALADPVKGLGALQKMGVVFTDAQKKMLKYWGLTNQAAKAQSYILEVLDSKFKGASQAARDADPYKALSVDLHNLLESFGEIIYNGLQPFVKVLSEAIAWVQQLSPEMKQLLVNIAIGAAVLGPVLTIIGLMGSGITTLIGLWSTLAGLIGGSLTLDALGGIAAAIASINPVILGIMAACVLLFNYIGAFFQGFIEGFGGVFKALLGGVFSDLVTDVGELIGILKNLFKALGANKELMQLFKDVGRVVGIIVGGAFSIVLNVILLIIDNVVKLLNLLGRLTGLDITPSGLGNFNPAPGSSVISGGVSSFDATQAQSFSSKNDPGQVIVDFKNVPSGVAVKQEKKSSALKELNIGYSFSGI